MILAQIFCRIKKILTFAILLSDTGALPEEIDCFQGGFIKINAKVAQLVERDLAKVEVAGSNPVFRSKGIPLLY